jgi:hypothetical protein
MGRINMGRVILGGLLAGLVINACEFVVNGLILAKDFDEAMKSLGKQPVGMQAVAVFLVVGFLSGIVTVWIYAAIRPRFGAGAKTAVCAGLLVWTLTSLLTTIGQAAIGIFPSRVLVIGTLWALVETPIAAVAGPWLYKEYS